MRIVGVDGTKRGWVAVVLDEGRFLEARLHDNFDEVVERHHDGEVLAVDMPVGLVEEGLREADIAARAAVGPVLRSSVFMTPPRVVVEQETWDLALSMAREHMGCGISKQAYALFARIREIDAHVGDERVVEVHPEVSFACLAGVPLTSRKKSWNGAMRRCALLRGAGLELPEDLGAAGAAPIDDVLDAAVAAWTASRVISGEAVGLPPEPRQFDRSGRPIVIWA